MQFLLGQKLSSNINLLAQVLILIGLWIGFYFARKKQFSRHRKMQTSLVLINSFFILFVMATSFYNYVILGGTTSGRVASLMIVHGTFGLLAELTGIYLILRMNTTLIPAKLRVSNYKLVMRSLLGLWTLVAFGGFAIYYARYLTPSPSTSALPAEQLLQASHDLQMHAGEMQDALKRGNLSTARRHAEHLINLAEGKQGPDYGDADGDGVVEDPGDGTGALVYLDRVLAASGQPAPSGSPAAQIAGEVRTRMLDVVKDALAVTRAGDIQAAAGPIAEAVALTQQIINGPNGNVAQLLETLNLSAAQATAAAPVAPSQGQAVQVSLKDFAFVPKILKVKAGTTVTFVNQDPVKHTVTSDTGLFDSGDILPGKSFSYTFNQAGTFPYFCVFHGDKGGVDMAGSVEVGP
jgi:plastocyanin/uncharacterized membrane protein YozB (DUF420 family)